MTKKPTSAEIEVALDWHKGIADHDEYGEWAAANESLILNALAWCAEQEEGEKK